MYIGTIIDSFGALRDEKMAAEQEMKSVCFICSQSEHDMEERGLEFQRHTTEDHNLSVYMMGNFTVFYF